jgi:hypothetical protein
MTSDRRNAAPRLASVNRSRSGWRIGVDSRIIAHTATPMNGKLSAWAGKLTLTTIPVDIAARYHAHSIDWTNHAAAAGLQFAGPLLAALNEGDIAGAAYRALVDPLDLPMDVVDRMPAAMRHRFGTAYATVELFDSMTRLAVDQTGSARTDGPPTLQAIKNVEHDIANPADAFHSQTALLEKINAAEAIGLRLEEQTNQFLMSSLEQQLLEGKRKRDAEAQLMNATMYQWRFGQNYGQDLFRHTAADLDAWRPY